MNTCCDKLSEKELGNLAANGAKAFERLLTLYRPALVRKAASILNNDDDAEDIVQDVSLKAFQSLRSMGEEKNIKAWLFKMVENASKNKVKKKPDVVPLDALADVLETEGSYDYLEQDLDKLAIKYFKELPVTQQKILTLTSEGYTRKQIGEKLGMDENTVKVNLFRARAYIKGKIAEPR